MSPSHPTRALLACLALVLALTGLVASPPPQEGPGAAVTSPYTTIANPRASEQELTDAIRQLGRYREPASFWARIAADEHYSRAHRRHAVFQLFHRHVPAHSTLGQLARTLHGAAWLQPDNMQKMGGLSGAWPFDPGENDSVFRFYVLCPRPPYWVVYLHLSDDVPKTDMLRVFHREKVAERVRDTVILHVLFSPRLEELYGAEK